MKKRSISGILCALIILFLNVSVAEAQVAFSLGVKAGATVTSFKGDQAPEVDTKTGLAGGLFANLSILEFLAVQPEFFLHQKGATTINTGNRNEIRVNYFTIPVLVKLRMPLGKTVYPNLFAGPNFSFLVDGRYTSTDMQNGNETQINISNVRNNDTGGIIGAGIDFEGQGVFFTVDVRYGFGFRTLGENTYSLNIKNEDITIMAGIGFRIGPPKIK